MRVVLDSNVWIAGLVASGTCRDVVADALSLAEVFTSPFILKEVDRALAMKVRATRQQRRRVRAWLSQVSHVTKPRPSRPLSCRDPKDLPILWLALHVHADLLVTGDKDLLSLETIRGISIIPPALFWKSLQTPG